MRKLSQRQLAAIKTASDQQHLRIADIGAQHPAGLAGKLI
jgi:hypothetical protein